MPWFCGYCTHWNLEKQAFCPQCGRSRKGRLCQRCRESVPQGARFCVGCGGEAPAEPGVRHRSPFLPASRWLRRLFGLGMLLGLGLLLWLLYGLLVPLLPAVFSRIGAWLWSVVAWVLLFWLLTGLLPSPWGAHLRRAAWSLARFLIRFLGNLFR